MSTRDPDIVRRDEHGIPVAIVEVKHAVHLADRSYLLRQLSDYLHRAGSVRYSFLVDPRTIEIFEGDPLEERSLTLPTSDILERYDHEYRERHNIDEGYLATLVNAWLDDLSFHWAALEERPGEKRLPQGLLDVLRAA
jgi:hypothetical protein